MADGQAPVAAPATSVWAQLSAPKAKSDKHGRCFHLRVETPVGLEWNTAAQTLLDRLVPTPQWVAVRRPAEYVEFIAVWGPELQPRREGFKKTVAQALQVSDAVVEEAMKSTGLRAWRFDAVAELRRLHAAAAPGLGSEVYFSYAGMLTGPKLLDLANDLGAPKDGDREGKLKGQAVALMERHVYGDEDFDARVLADQDYMADLLRRKGPEKFITEQRTRLRRLELKGATLVSLCSAAAAGAEPYLTSDDVHGSVFQLTIAEGVATPRHQTRGVIVVGPARTGKSHIGHQLYGILPSGTVVKVQEADAADIYSFGTKLCAETVLLQIDEFEAKTHLSKLRNLLDPHSEGFEVRTGSSKSGSTHTCLPESLMVIVTSNWTKAQLDSQFLQQGAKAADIDAFWERVTLIDLYAAGVEKRPKEERVDLEPARVAATVAHFASTGPQGFTRQAPPPERPRPLKATFPHLADAAPEAKRRRLSAPATFPGSHHTTQGRAAQEDDVKEEEEVVKQEEVVEAEQQHDERRQEPETGASYTWEEYTARFAAMYSASVLDAYWKNRMTPMAAAQPVPAPATPAGAAEGAGGE